MSVYSYIGKIISETTQEENAATIFFKKQDRDTEKLKIKELINKDCKYTKFGVLIDDLRNDLGMSPIIYIDNYSISLLEIIFDIKELNDYAKYIILGCDKTESYAIIEYYDKKRITIKELIKICRESSSDKYNCIFWSLFVLAVDENQYKSKLNTISDTAYLVGFTEDMLKDWIKAIRLILSAQNYRNGNYITKEAKEFFQK